MLEDKPLYEAEQNLMTLYKRLRKRDKSTQYVKADLHVHSPASADYVWTNKGPEATEDDEYRLFVETFLESDVQIMAVTDHNSVKGYLKIQELLGLDSALKWRLGKKLILPGVEITCYQQHFVVIFSENTEAGTLNHFLFECGISIEDQGNEEASADRVSPLLLCEKARENKGIVLIAHCDAEHGLLQSFFGRQEELGFKGKSVERILKSSAVYGICYNDPGKLGRLQELKAQFGVDLPLLQASDSHSSSKEYRASGRPLGQRSTLIKLGPLCFRSLCLALRNEESRILHHAPSTRTNPVLLGIAINGGFLRDMDKVQSWAVIPFSEELNCIVGARGTGKSTLLDILKYVLNPQNKAVGTRVIDRFDKAIVFVRTGETYAIVLEPIGLNRPNAKYYVLKGDAFHRLSSNIRLQSSLKRLTNNLRLSEYLTSENIQSYDQKELFFLATMPEGPTLVTENLCALMFREDFARAKRELQDHAIRLISQATVLLKDRKRDPKADLTSPYLESQYKAFVEANRRITQFQREIIDHLNIILCNRLAMKGSLGIALNHKETYEETIEKWRVMNRMQQNAPYEHLIDLRKVLKNLFRDISEDWAVPFYLFTKNAESLAETTGLTSDIANELCGRLCTVVEPTDLLIVPRLIVDFELNVKHGISNEVTYRKRNELSLGQRAVGMLLLILHGATELGETRPLLIDQPEDDLDNVYIYQTLVKEFQRLKKTRQLLIATHNPNIPIAGDAENILVLESDGDSGWVQNWGSIDREEIIKKVLQILEGDREAFMRRAWKYDLA